MGDMADMCIEQMFNIWEDGDPYDYDNEDVGPVKLQQPRKKTCRACGVSNLTWMETKDGWRLGAYGRIHQCAVVTGSVLTPYFRE